MTDLESKTLQAGSVLSHYLIVEKLGEGGMGVVYKARDDRLRRFVALKLLAKDEPANSEHRQRFLQEARAVSALDHPHIVTVHDLASEGGLDFIVMEYVRGTSLRELITRGRLPLAEALRYAVQIAGALAAAHRAGIVHRDLKPGNVMVTVEGDVKVLDFGLAKLTVDFERGDLEQDDDTEPVTRSGAVLGTQAYMSPEQAMGEPIDSRSDIFSFGEVLYEMLIGQHPFRGRSEAALLRALFYQEPVPLRRYRPELPAALESLVTRALAKHPDQRYQSVEDMARELEDLRRAGAPETRVTASPAPISPALIESEPVTATDATAFVAREEELRTLDGLLDMALSGRGRVVFVAGEAGSGKTALASELARRAAAKNAGLAVVSGQCNAHTGVGDPYLPFREVLRQLAGDVGARKAAGAMTPEQAARLWNLSPLALEALVDSSPDLIGTLVSAETLLDLTGAPSWQERIRALLRSKAAVSAASGLQQIDLLEQFTRLLHHVARHHPLLVVLDDLQWADAGSISLLFHLGRRIGTDRILVLGAYRPSEVAVGRGGERHPLAAVINELRGVYGDVEVRIGKAQGRRFIDAYLEADRLDSEFRAALFEHTGGYPLFTIEFLRAMERQGVLTRDAEGRRRAAAALDWHKLPARVEALISERIGRLPAQLREVLTLASVEGEEFTAEAVAEVAGVDELHVVRLLSGELDKRHRLVRAHDLRYLEDRRLSIYRFRHILFQKYLYGTLDRVERAHLHGEMGRVLERLYDSRTEEVAVQLARHFAEAGEVEKTVDYLLSAGRKAQRLSADREAVGHFTAGLEQLAGLPPGSRRRQLELGLTTGLGPALIATAGYAAPEVARTYRRARELCRESEKTTELFWAIRGLWSFYLTRADFEEASRQADELIRLARSWEDPALLRAAHYAAGQGVDAMGDHLAAHRHLSRAQAQAPRGVRDHPDPVTDAEVDTLTFHALVLWQLGLFDRAAEHGRRALSLADELAHPFSQAFALGLGAVLQHFFRDHEGVRRLTSRLLDLCAERSFPFWSAFGQVLEGWALAESGKGDDTTLQVMRQALDAYRSTGARFLLTYMLDLLVEAALRCGELAAARRYLDEALTRVEETGERFWQAELLRNAGELELAAGDGDRAAGFFEQALTLARSRGALAPALRAAMALGRLLQGQGKRPEAHRLIAEVYGAFTEGFETADLRAARALLAGLE